MMRQSLNTGGLIAKGQDREQPTSLFLLNSLAIGGSERKIVRLVNELHQSGKSVAIAYLNEPETLLRELNAGVPRYHLRRRGRLSLGAIKRLQTIVRELRAGTIVCVSLYPLLYAAATWYLRNRKSLAVIVLVNTTKFIHKRMNLFMILYAPLMNSCDAVVFGCKTQRQEWMHKYKLETGKCVVVYNGVDTHFFRGQWDVNGRRQLKHSMGIPQDSFVVGTIGRLSPEKQQADLIRVIADLAKSDPRIRGLIVGDGPEKTKLETLAYQNNVRDKISFLGELQDVRQALAIIDVFILTSVAVETFSNAALEAMAMGKPVILSDIGGAREMVSQGVNGYVFEKGNVEQLRELLMTVRSEPGLAHSLGSAGRQRVVECFSFDRMVEKYRKLLMGQRIDE